MIYRIKKIEANCFCHGHTQTYTDVIIAWPSAEGRSILLILSDKILIKWPALLLFSQMVDIAMTKRVVEKRDNFEFWLI